MSEHHVGTSTARIPYHLHVRHEISEKRLDEILVGNP